ncbi:MAG: hypothetical protein WC634_02110 [archaeon]
MGMTRGFLPSPMDVYVKKGDIVTAVIRASTDVETILFSKLFFEKKMDINKSDKTTLGKYIKLAEKQGIFSEDILSLLKEFRDVRNRISHERGYIELMYRDANELRKVKKLLKQIRHFIRQTRIKTDMEREYLYSEQVRKNEHL